MACGSFFLVEGTLSDGNGTTGFINPRDVPLLKRFLGFGRRSVRAYGCVHSQYLQLAVMFSKSDLERYQQFEGEQSNVLERIKSEPTEL